VGDGLRALRAAGASLIYKKVDSNLRGNIGAELAAALDALGGPILFAPAFPARERTIVNGVCLICDTPVAETEMARDPEAPVTQSNVLELLRSQRADLDLFPCPLSVVRAGALALRASIPPHGVLVLDSETDDDLDLVAKVALSLDPLPVLAGSAGLAAALARLLFGLPASPRWPAGKLGPVFAVLASSSEVLPFQISAASAAGFAAISFPCQNLTREDQMLPKLEAAIEAAIRLLSAGRDAIVHASGPLPQVERPVDLVVEHLAHLTYVVTQETRPHALLVGGGSTAQAVLEALGAEALEIDDEPLPGMAAGLIIGGAWPVGRWCSNLARPAPSRRWFSSWSTQGAIQPERSSSERTDPASAGNHNGRPGGRRP